MRIAGLLRVMMAALALGLAAAPAAGQDVTATPSHEELLAAEIEKCNAGDGSACWYPGIYYGLGYKGLVEKDSEVAAAFFEKGCDAGAALSCHSMGRLYLAGEGVPLDTAKAVSYYQRACDGGDNFGCFDLGGLYYRGERVEQNYTIAVANYGRACDLDLSYACFELGLLYQNGQGVPKNMTKAAELFDQACRMGVSYSC